MPPPLPTNIGNRAANENDRVLQKRHLQDLLQNIDPLGQLDDEVEEVCFRTFVLIHYSNYTVYTKSSFSLPDGY